MTRVVTDIVEICHYSGELIAEKCQKSYLLNENPELPPDSLSNVVDSAFTLSVINMALHITLQQNQVLL